jgi:site-specific recombinase XerD
MPIEPTNKSVRTREFLTADEVGPLMIAANKVGRHPFRNHALILLAYRYGFRVSE